MPRDRPVSTALTRRSWPLITDDDKARVLDCLQSGQLWRGDSGRYLRDLEQQFGALHQTRHALAVTNGTHALELSLAALGIGMGDEVLVPAFTFIASATSVLMRNALPVPVDVEPDTFCIDPDTLEERITDRTRAIMPVHLAGHACNMEAILSIARRRGLLVVEDCAQAHGARFRDLPVGSMGHFGAFSFQAGKAMTSGEGGMVVTNDPHLHDIAYSLFNCGRVLNGSNNNYVCLGSNYRMPELLAALLVGQIARLAEQTRWRQEAVDFLAERLADLDGIEPQARRDYARDQTYSLYYLRYDSAAFGGAPRDALLDALSAQGFSGVAGHPVFYRAPFFASLAEDHRQFRDLGERLADHAMSCSVAESVSRRVLWFRHSLLLSGEAELRRFVDVIRSFQHRSRVRVFVPASVRDRAPAVVRSIDDYDLYIFDLDGTIFQSRALMVRALDHCHVATGLTHTPEYERFFSMMGAPLERIFVELGLTSDHVELYRRFTSENMHQVEIYREVLEVVCALASRGKKLAVFTGKDRRRTLDLLDAHGMTGYFGAVVTSDDVREGKPHPEGLHRIIDLLSGTPATTLLVGDGLFDLECAARGGVDCAFVTWSEQEPSALPASKPRWHFHDPRDFRGAFASCSGAAPQ